MKYAIYILYGIALISIILGFIALLKQKTYIDAETQKVTEIELPFLGKMSTNYPSLIFLFLGIGLAAFVFNKTYDKKKTWYLSGKFIDTTKTITDFSEGELNLMPSSIHRKTIKPNGDFDIEIELNDGPEFEDLVEAITYSHRLGSQTIQPRDEMDKKKKNPQNCLLQLFTPSTRKYNPVILSNF